VWEELVARARAGDGLERLSGGMNNGVVVVDGLCVKLYKIDERRRWEREWRALSLLRGHGVAPEPLYYDPDGAPPIVVMERLPGRPLHEQPLDAGQLAAVQDATARLYAVDASGYWTPTWGTPERFAGVMAATAERLATHEDPLARESAARLRGWLATDDRALLERPRRVIFSHGDSFAANFLWDGARVCFCDFEYAGTCDLDADLGEMAEGTHVRHVDEAAWEAFVAPFGVERARWLAGRRMCAHLWLAIFWRPSREQTRERIESQIGRIEHVGRLR
jgi:hypothetical protein